MNSSGHPKKIDMTAHILDKSPIFSQLSIMVDILRAYALQIFNDKSEGGI